MKGCKTIYPIPQILSSTPFNANLRHGTLIYLALTNIMWKFSSRQFTLTCKNATKLDKVMKKNVPETFITTIFCDQIPDC